MGNVTAREVMGEVIGTFIMCFFGIGAVATATLAGAHTGPFQVGMVWGLAIAIAIYCTRNLSCAHFNPAVTVAMAVTGRLEGKKVLPYLIGQFIGAFVAALILWIHFAASVNGLDPSWASASGPGTAASIWCEQITNSSALSIGVLEGSLAEGIGVFVLVFVIFSMTEDANAGKPGDVIFPLFIGLTVTLIICTAGPMTDAGLNPARDILPRVMWLAAGGDLTTSGLADWGVWVVYVVAPLIGGVLAGLFYTQVVDKMHKAADAA